MKNILSLEAKMDSISNLCGPHRSREMSWGPYCGGGSCAASRVGAVDVVAFLNDSRLRFLALVSGPGCRSGDRLPDLMVVSDSVPSTKGGTCNAMQHGAVGQLSDVLVALDGFNLMLCD